MPVCGSYIVTGRQRDNLAHADFMALVARVARALAAGLQTLAPRTPFAEGLVLSGSVIERFANRKAGRELGYRPLVPLEDAVRS